jgi:hypothetical protein
MLIVIVGIIKNILYMMQLKFQENNLLKISVSKCTFSSKSTFHPIFNTASKEENNGRVKEEKK